MDCCTPRLCAGFYRQCMWNVPMEKFLVAHFRPRPVALTNASFSVHFSINRRIRGSPSGCSAGTRLSGDMHHTTVLLYTERGSKQALQLKLRLYCGSVGRKVNAIPLPLKYSSCSVEQREVWTDQSYRVCTMFHKFHSDYVPKCCGL